MMTLIKGAKSASDDPPIVECAGAVILLGRQFVVLVRPTDPSKDEWLLPKGHLEAGETFPEAAIREALEETGATCRMAGEDVIRTTHHLSGEGEKVTSWFLLQAVALKTEKAEVLKSDAEPERRRHIGIFPSVVALARLTYAEHREVLASVLGGVEE